MKVPKWIVYTSCGVTGAIASALAVMMAWNGFLASYIGLKPINFLQVASLMMLMTICTAFIVCILEILSEKQDQ